jgi:hypothetical protein
VAYRTSRSIVANIELKKASGLGVVKSLPPLGDGSTETLPNSWSPGDRQILCSYQKSVREAQREGTSTGSWELMLLPADGGKAERFLAGPGNTIDGQISPDGKFVAYASDESSEWEIYVTTFPGANGKWQVSSSGGVEPRWRGDGKAIFFIGPKQLLTEATVSSDGAFSVTGERALFPVHSRPPNSSTDMWTYDVTRDGKRFLVNQAVKPERAPPIHIVLHAAGPVAK